MPHPRMLSDALMGIGRVLDAPAAATRRGLGRLIDPKELEFLLHPSPLRADEPRRRGGGYSDKIDPFGFYIDNPYDRTMGDLDRWHDREIDLMPYRLIPSGPVIDMPNYYPPKKGVPLFDPGEAVSIERSI